MASIFYPDFSDEISGFFILSLLKSKESITFDFYVLMNVWKTFLLRFGIYAVLAGFLAVFAYYKYYKPDSENVILIGGSNGNYYVKIKEYNSDKDIQIVINKLFDEKTNRQILLSEGKYKINGNCDKIINTIENLMNNIDYFQEEENKLIFINRKCYLEKNLY